MNQYCESAGWVYVRMRINNHAVSISNVYVDLYVCTQTINYCTHHNSPDLHEVGSCRHVSSHVSWQHRVKCGARGVVTCCHIRQKQYTYNSSLSILTIIFYYACYLQSSSNICLSQTFKSSKILHKCKFLCLLLGVSPTATWCDSEILVERCGRWRPEGCWEPRQISYWPNVHFSFVSLKLASSCFAAPQATLLSFLILNTHAYDGNL